MLFRDFFRRLRPPTGESRRRRGHRAPLDGHAVKIASPSRTQLTEHARIATSHARIPCVHRTREPLEVGPSCRRRSPHAARAQTRRSEAPTRPMLEPATTAAATRMPASVRKSWRRCRWPPSACSHHLPANLPNAGIVRCGEGAKVSRGQKEGSCSKRCLPEVKPRCVAAEGHSPRDSSSTFTGSTRRAPGFTKRVTRMYLPRSSALRASHRVWTGA